MAYFPMFVDIKEESCIVIGAGEVAYRKVTALLDFEAKVTVIGVHICEGIRILERQNLVTVKEKAYEESDIKDAYFVIAATDDTALNKKISVYCKENRIPVNVVDVQKECSFIFPAYIQQGPITVGITSSGTSPVITQKIKKMVSNIIPDYYGELSDSLGNIRDEVKNQIDTEKNRKEIYKKLLQLGEERKGKINQKDFDELIEKRKECED